MHNFQIMHRINEQTNKKVKRNYLTYACNSIKRETLAQVLSCEFCEIPKNTFLRRTPLVAASYD